MASEINPSFRDSLFVFDLCFLVLIFLENLVNHHVVLQRKENAGIINDIAHETRLTFRNVSTQWITRNAKRKIIKRELCMSAA